MPGEPTSEGQPASAQGRTIPVTCETHGGCRGFGNLRVRRQGGDIVLDPHVTGACVIGWTRRPRLRCLICSGSGWGELDCAAAAVLVQDPGWPSVEPSRTGSWAASRIPPLAPSQSRRRGGHAARSMGSCTCWRLPMWPP